MIARWVAVLLLLGLVVADAPGQVKPKGPAKPKAGGSPAGYRKQAIQGFTLYIHEDVFKNNDDPKWDRKPLDVLDLELSTIVKKLPPRAVTALRRLLVWIEWADESDPDLDRGVVAKYYGVYGNLALWSLGKNKHPLKANNIEVVNMQALTREHQPGVKLERCVLLHEMAHAVHHQVIGMSNAGVRSAFRAARERGLYAEAKDVYGRTLRPTYAATNDREYFAELTCAYLDKLYYFPHTADDLKEYDPTGYKVMEQVWGSRKRIDGALKGKGEKDAAVRLERARTQYIAGRKKDGLATLEALIEAFPATKAAATAKEWLERWQKEEKK
ncbi:MAG: hypothetical protein U0736_21740 [Gemmataceae bacterium]